MDSNSDKRGAPSRGPGRIVDKARAFVRKMKEAKVLKRTKAVVMTSLLGASSVMSAAAPMAAYAVEPRSSSTPSGTGWYYLVANGSDAVNGFVLNLEGCRSGTGVNAFVTDQHRGNESMLKMAENMWYVQDVGGGWFTIRNVHGYALSANEDGHDNLPTASYNSGDAAQKWHIDGGKLVAQNGDTMKLANGLTQGSPVCDQNNRSSQDVTWSFERVNVQGTISGYSQKQNVGTKITTPTFDPGAHIGYTKTDNADMDANRSAGVKVSFAVKNGDGAERGLPYTISDSDKGKTISLIAHVKSAFGAEMWTTTFDMTVNETHEEGSTGGQQGGQVGVDPGGVGEEGGQINNPDSVDGVVGDTWVGRWDSTAMHQRNHIVLSGDATLTDADIKLININSKIIEDTAINTQETGFNKEYVIDVSTVEQDTSSAGIEATYRNVGYDPIDGRSISVLMRMTNFVLTDPGYINKMNTTWQLPRSNEEIKGEGNVPPYEDPNAIFYPTPNIRLAANFDGGYWMLGVEKVTIDYYFYYDNDPTQAVDLTNAFLTVRSLDHDGNGLSWNGQELGQEAVSFGGNKYEHALLTPESKVGRWGDITGFSSKVYPSTAATDMDSKASAFYNPTPIMGGEHPFDLAVTLYGVKDGSNHFVFDMIDTGANTHNMPYFGTLGTVEPPEPVKYVKDKETGDWVDYDDGYLLDSTTQFKVEQFIPGRDEQLGNYTSVSFTDTISDDLEVTGFHVYREDGSEVTSGTKQLGNNLKYDFDLGAEDVYGHTYSFVIDVKVVDYPEGPTLIIPNSAQTHFGASNGTLDMQTNEVKIELINPELRVWKEIVIDDDASVINDYEYLIGDVITYDAYVINENAGTRAKDVTFYDHLPDGLDYIEGSIMVTDANGNTVNVADDGNGWKLTFTNFDYNKPVKVRYQAYATEAGNGTEVINRAKAWAVNVPKDVDGNETQEAWNESEAYINDPNLKVLKSVTQSPIQNPDYQQGEEYRVDDTFRYTVTVVNTEPGTFAENVIITDDQLPEGFELIGGPTVTGLDENGFPKTIEFPKHFDDDLHGQHETHKIQWSTKPIKHDDTGSWGWEVDVNFLAYGMTCSVTWEVRATDAMNGYEVYNRAWAKAENQPNDTFWSTDDSSDETRGNEYTVVWINNPEFVIDKSVRKTDQAYQIGDVAAYDIEVKGLRTPGTLARQTTLDDEFLQEGTTIIENSFIITDKPTEDQPQDISDQVELNRYVGKQGWHIDMTQVYGDTHGYWVNSEDWRPIYKDGAPGRIDGEHNPVKTKPEYDKEDCESDDVDYAHDYFKVHYEATINDMALQNEIIHNEATIDSIESFPVTDDAEVTAIGAQLMINKDSNDGGGFTVGDVAEYEITITNNATGTVAENVQIKDGFTTAMPGTVSIVEGSIKVYDNQNKQLLIAPSQITYTRNESGNIFGFTIDTGYDLPSSQKLTVRYDVKYLANNGGQVITNVAYTWADNAPEVNDPYETWPDDMDQSDLRLDKGSDKQVYDSDGDFGTYTLNIVNHSDETALNVTINDDITTDTLGIAQIVQGSVSVWDHHGDAVSWDRLVYHYANGGQIKGFTIYTDHDLEPNERMQVVYQVRFDETAQQTQVHNEAWASADNTGKANDDNDVTLNPGGTPPTTPPDPGDPDPEWPPHNPNHDDPELAIVKESNKNWFTPGEQGHYSLRVTNPEYGTTAENVVVTDTLDADARKYASIIEGSVKVTDAMGNAVAVENASFEKDSEGRVWGIKIATGYDLAYGGALNVTYDVTFDGDINGQVDVHNAATADADNTPPADTDHVVHLDTEGTPELVLDKSADKTEVAPGDTLTYTVAVSQPAEGMTVKDVVITDTLPEGFELDQASVKVEKDGQAQTVSAEFPAGKLRVKLGDVAYGEKWVVTYSGTVSEDFLGDELHNVVIGESPDIPEDPEDETTTPIHKPRLQIEKVASAHQVKPGDDLDWTITVVQTMRGATATNTVVTDQLPDGYVAESADVVVTDALGNPRNEHHTLVNGLLTVQLGDLAYNDPVIITIHGKVRDDFGGERLTNTAVADADNVPDPVDDTDEALLGAKLEIEKVADRDYAKVGGELNWEITVTQVTPEAVAKNAVVTDELPDGFVATAADVTVADARGNDRTRTCSITLEDGKLTVGLGDLAYNDPLTITIHGKVAEDFEGDSILNRAIADADNIPDPVEDEDEVSLTPRLAIEKTADRKTANPGDRLTWSIRVSQIVEGATAHNVVMTDELPDGFTADRDLIAVVDADGNAWENARVDLNEDDELTVELGDMEYGHDATILVPGTISDDYDDDTMTNVAVADADDAPEPVDDDETVDFGDVPPLDIIKDADRVLVSPGDRVNYTVTTTVGNGALKNVIVADDIPDGLTLDEDSLKAYVNGVPFDTTGKLTIKDGDILLAVGDLAARDVVKLTYRCTVDDDVLRGSALKNVATATAAGTDPVRDDETVRTPGDVPPLDIVKEADRTEVAPGQTVGYTVTTTVGDGDLDDVTVTDVLPDGLSLVDGSVMAYINGAIYATDGHLTVEGQTLTLDAGDRRAGDEIRITYSCTVDDAVAAGTSLKNVATAEADGVDPVDDDATVTNPGENPPLTMAWTADKSTVQAGDKVGYTITTKATGDLTNVVVTDDVPMGLTVDESTVKATLNGEAFDTTGKLTFDNGDIKLAVGSMKAGDTLVITYTATVDENVKGGSQLTNTAIATADGVDPVTDTATVTVPCPENPSDGTPSGNNPSGGTPSGTNPSGGNPSGTPGSNGYTDIPKDLGKNLGKTGDVLAQFLPAIVVSMGIICLACVAMYNREEIRGLVQRAFGAKAALAPAGPGDADIDVTRNLSGDSKE